MRNSRFVALSVSLIQKVSPFQPGGGYHFFCGRDASRGLAKSSLDPATLDEKAVGDLSGLDEEELNTLDEWVERFEEKYPVVGVLAGAEATTARL